MYPISVVSPHSPACGRRIKKEQKKGEFSWLFMRELSCEKQTPKMRLVNKMAWERADAAAHFPTMYLLRESGGKWQKGNKNEGI